MRSQYPEPCHEVRTWCESRALSQKPHLIATRGRGRAEECVKNHPILLANLLQSSSSTFSCVSFPSFFAFQEGMWDTQISALLSSPTVSHPFVTHFSRAAAWAARGHTPLAMCH